MRKTNEPSLEDFITHSVRDPNFYREILADNPKWELSQDDLRRFWLTVAEMKVKDMLKGPDEWGNKTTTAVPMTNEERANCIKYLEALRNGARDAIHHLEGGGTISKQDQIESNHAIGALCTYILGVFGNPPISDSDPTRH